MTATPLAARWAAALAVLGGLLTWAAFPRLSVRPLAVLGPALLYVAVARQPWRRALWLGLAFGLAFFVPLLSWLQTGAGTNAWLVLAVLEAAFVAVSAVGLSWVSRLPLWPAWGAAVWVLQEAARGRLPFGGFTWGRLGFSQDSGPLLRWASVGGAPLMTFAVALAAGCLVVLARHAARTRLRFSGSSPPQGGVREAPALLRRAQTTTGGVLGRLRAIPARRRPAALPDRRLDCGSRRAEPRGPLLALAALVTGAMPYLVAPLLPHAPPPARRTTVALVQGNVPRLGLASFDPKQQEMVVRNHVEATYELAAAVDAGTLPRPSFVVWPENSTDRDPRTDDVVRVLVEGAVQRIGTPVLVGALLDRPDRETENAGLVWDPLHGPGATYAKRHLVPFGEYVPFRRQLTPFFGRLSLVGNGFVPGHSVGALDIAGTRVGDVICFEIAYDGLVRDSVRAGAEVLVVQTNNASFGRSALTDQQLAMSRVRAVEHGRAVLVAATSGISAVVAPDGSFVDRSKVFTRDLLVHEVPLITSRTLATRAGAWPEWLLAAMGGVAVLAGAVRVRRS
jgi:apolipoprotein N-acyltransferase